jgi:UDP-glucose 4-epimerase
LRPGTLWGALIAGRVERRSGVRVVVTGGAGFIGGNLCAALVEDGHEVIALDDLSTGDPVNLAGSNATLVEGSILDDSALDAALDGAGAVVHLAARPSVPRSIAEPAAAHEVNATGTLRLLEAARRHGSLHVVMASSSSVYGANETLPKSEDLACRPRSPYAGSKLAAESYALAWQSSYGLPTLAFRFFNVFGPLQRAGHAYAAVVPAFLDAALEGRPLPVHGDGGQTRDFTFVGTVSEILVRAVRDRVTSEDPVNLAFGGRHTLLEVIDQLSVVLGRPLEVDHLAPRAGDVRHSQADNARLRRLFPDVEPIGLASGMEQTAAWFQRDRRP